MKATRRNLQAQPNMLKKNHQNTKSTNQNENFPKKSMLSTLKKNRSQYSYGSYPMEFEAQPKILKKS
jgi:hypothetical protein